jgi:hypothetical protein
VSTILDKFDKCESGSLLCQATTLNAVLAPLQTSDSVTIVGLG